MKVRTVPRPVVLHITGFVPLSEEQEKCVSRNIPALELVMYVVEIILRFPPLPSEYHSCCSKGITRDNSFSKRSKVVIDL